MEKISWVFKGICLTGSFLFMKGGGVMPGTSVKISKKIFNEVYLSQLENYKTRFNVFYGGA